MDDIYSDNPDSLNELIDDEAELERAKAKLGPVRYFDAAQASATVAKLISTIEAERPELMLHDKDHTPDILKDLEDCRRIFEQACQHQTAIRVWIDF